LPWLAKPNPQIGGILAVMHPLLNIALQGARAAGNQLLREFDRISNYQDDRQASLSNIRSYLEQDFADRLKQKYPAHTLLFRPSTLDLSTFSSDETVWVVDLLNGEPNYQRGIPQFALCIAIIQENKVEHALIYDPMMNETFSGTRAQQGQCNNVRMRISENTGKNTIYIAGNQTLEGFTQPIQTLQTGCNALMLAYTASGRYDAFVGSSLSPLEVAIGSVLIKSAGGMTTDLQGGDHALVKQELVGGNLKFLKVLLQRLAS
jgi:myo-inositol-1(or 4)-monophosphatase